MSRLTRLERVMLIHAAGFVLAGEWPWETENHERDSAALARAVDKLRASISERAERRS